ncbi:GNAT family N-acetyltransferase [Kineococcus esterisolvens]|uniref:GNAT family N-acetyltransferase n=1 Tax=unclassified Kineococcus TaxID=2621656 RepID=UPI003D7E854F
MTPPLPDGYTLLPTAPSVEDYLHLRERAGLSPKTPEQARAAIPGSWAACHVHHQVSGQDGGRAVGMGRVLGDGGWYFHIVDIAVLPEHQRRGLGDAVLSALVDEVHRRAPAGAYVNLLADPPGRRLYARHGFQDTAPGSIGMALRLP